MIDFASVVGKVADGILVFDSSLGVVYFNEAIVRMGGFRDHESARQAFDALRVGPWPGVRIFDPSGVEVPFEDWPASRALRLEPFRALELRVVDELRGRHWTARFDGMPLALVGGSGFVITVVDLTARQEAERALRETQERLALAHRLAGSGTWDWNIDTNTLWWSPELCELYGVAAAPTDFEVARQRIHPDDRELLRLAVEDVLAGRRDWDMTYRIIHPTRGLRWVHGMGRVTYAEGRPVRLTGMSIDVTDRQAAAAELQSRTEQLRMITDAVPVYIAYVDRDFRYQFVNMAYSKIVGVSREEILGRHMSDVLPEETYARARPHLERALTGEECHYENAGERPGISRHIFDSRMVPHRLRDGRVIGVYVVATDITSLKQAEEALRELNRSLEDRVKRRTRQLEEQATRLRALAAELTDSEQRAQRRIAEVIHDHLQQLLVAARMRVVGSVRDISCEESRRMAEDAAGILTQAIEVSRSLSVELRPPVLYDTGLAAALQWLGEWMHDHHRLAVSVFADESVEPADDRARALLFSAARELLFNVVKHAQSDRAHLDLRKVKGRRIRVRVQDEGRGFDPADVVQGFGLFSIRERLRALGGDMLVVSRPGLGTRIDLLLPLESPVVAARPPRRRAKTPPAA